MKRINKILIPTITALSTVALLVPSTSIATSVVNNSTNNSSIVNSINYVTVTFNTDTGVTLEGPTTAKVRSGSIFGTVKKPIATKTDYVFKGWSETQGGTLLTETTPVSKNLSLYPVFEQVTEAITITADTTLSPIPSTLVVNFTATGKPIAPATSVTWAVTPASTFKGTVSIDASTGALTTSYDAYGDVVVTATADGVVGSKTVSIAPPYINSDKVWIRLYYEDQNMYLSIDNIDEICDVDNEQVNVTMLNYGSRKMHKESLASDMGGIAYIGDKISSIPDNFLIANTTTATYKWEYPFMAVVFPSTSKCSHIGKCFMQGCKNNNQTISLPSSIKMIDEGFMQGCAAWNNGGSAFTIPTNTTIIGRNFLKGCSAFAQDLTVPESVTYVGDSFMTNCDGMDGKTLTINADPDYFVSSASPYSLTLTTSTTAMTTGVSIASDNGYADSFITRFPDRTEAPYRKLNIARVDFSTCEWSEIIEWANDVEAGNKTTTELCNHFKKHDGSAITSIDDFAGLETKPILINGLEHKVRVLEVQHKDDLIVESGTATSTKATFTFELETLLSDSSGNQLKCKWGTSSYNYDYNNSVLFKNLTGQGSSTIEWWDSTNTLLSSEKRTVLQMLPTEIQNSIKTLQKSVAISTDSGSSYTSTAYQANLFPLTLTEMAITDATYAKTEGSAYKHWSNNEQQTTTEAKAGRVKKDVNGNTPTKNTYSYWLSSPYMSNPIFSCCIYQTGTIEAYSVGAVNCVTFAFCI